MSGLSDRILLRYAIAGIFLILMRLEPPRTFAGAVWAGLTVVWIIVATVSWIREGE